MTVERIIAAGEPYSILIVLLTWVGDFVTATPLLRTVRTRIPSARITLPAGPNLRYLIEEANWVTPFLRGSP